MNFHIIGVMSGTSVDGIDIAHFIFKEEDNITFEILETETIPYSQEWVNILKNAIQLSDQELDKLNINYTEYLGKCIADFIKKYQLENTVKYIASHGHTIKHQPHLGITLQIGNLPSIATIVKKTVICDFRVQDVLLGGQGAPLVPIGDELLFKNYDYCLNIGGFSNISTKINGERIAFDISPANIVLNHYCNLLNLDYDDKGATASSGVFNKKLFEELNSITFYQMQAPKSLGLEFVKKEIFPVIEKHSLEISNILNTFVHHIAFQISKVIGNNKSLFITGGGAYNDFLVQMIKHYAPSVTIIIPEKTIIEYKEALIFALLGYLKLNDKINVLKSYTGASKDHSSGVIFKLN